MEHASIINKFKIHTYTHTYIHTNNGTDYKRNRGDIQGGGHVRSNLVPKSEKGAKYGGSSGRTPRYPGTSVPILANAKGA